MAFKYKQSAGELVAPDGTSRGFGFAGNGPGLNNPAAQDQHDVGPLPQGLYTMTEWIQSHQTMGLCVIKLTPADEKVMFGRSAFFIHGAVLLDKEGLAAFLKSSDGCICFGNCVSRAAIWNSGDRELQVVA